MNKITIGIPKALLYYKYSELWTSFFEELGCEIIVSPNTSKKILEDGIKFSLDESCMAMKIYMGHVYYLIDKCDYILVPRLKCIKKHEKLCTNFSALYDLVNNIFDKKLINYNVDVEHKEDELYAFVTMGLSLGFSYRKIVSAYHIAKEKEKMLKEREISKQKSIIASSNKIKILLAGHPYNLHDEFIGKQIENVLEKNDIEIIYSDKYDTKYLEQEVKKISPKNYWTYNKEIIGAISHYQELVDGIILITSFPCGPDSLSNEMILRNVKIPITNLIIDEANSDTGLLTRIESFIDILEERRKNHDERENN
jgi:predicted nucleotide-binding protein (sugar kinase/HSP70/actin superfamily)